MRSKYNNSSHFSVFETHLVYRKEALDVLFICSDCSWHELHVPRQLNKDGMNFSAGLIFDAHLVIRVIGQSLRVPTWQCSSEFLREYGHQLHH